MKILIAIDSFKGSMSSLTASKAIEEGLKTFNNIDTTIVPIADGGEGTLEAFYDTLNCKLYETIVTSAINTRIKVKYLITNDNKAIIEVAQIVGLSLLKENQRNPLDTTTYGIGELIIYIYKTHNIKDFIIGLGGSSTNDAGAGMLMALGVKLLNKDNKPIALGAKGLKDLVKIDTSCLNKYKELKFILASDVINPLTGINGCTYVYSKQKGASNLDIKNMEEYISNFALLTSKINGTDYTNYSGSGSAGGLAFAFLSYLNSSLTSGIKLLIEKTNLEEKIINSDIIITGEGKIDNQSMMGKVLQGISTIANKHHKKIVAFCGINEMDEEIAQQNNITIYQINDDLSNIDHIMDSKIAYENLKNTVIKHLPLCLCGIF